MLQWNFVGLLWTELRLVEAFERCRDVQSVDVVLGWNDVARPVVL